jgi:N-acetylmuramoyl-L-alanine amidase
VEQLGLSVRTIMVDAGHGGKDPGARGFGLQEKDVNLRMALILGKALKAKGFRVLYTRTTDDFLPLEERTSMANAKKADLFLSVHCNALSDASMHGFETYSLNLAKTPDAVRVAARENSVSDKNISDLQMILTDLMLTSKIKESVALARGVHKSGLGALRSRWNVADNGTREAPFYVLMGAKMPAVLMEIGYITNKTEAARLAGDAYLKALAGGIAEGIVAYKQQIERYTAK